METTLKVILSVAAIAVAMVSPAMARSHHYTHRNYHVWQGHGPYTPNAPAPRSYYSHRDFQDGSRG